MVMWLGGAGSVRQQDGFDKEGFGGNFCRAFLVMWLENTCSVVPCRKMVFIGWIWGGGG